MQGHGAGKGGQGLAGRDEAQVLPEGDQREPSFFPWDRARVGKEMLLEGRSRQNAGWVAAPARVQAWAPLRRHVLKVKGQSRQELLEHHADLFALHQPPGSLPVAQMPHQGSCWD